MAWKGLGWQAAGFAEIAAFPSAVLKHHYPDVRNYGDFTKIKAEDVGPIDLLVGGTPCQSFSISGLRGGLADERGNLALEYLRLADRLRPRWILWENVAGVLSSVSHAAPDPCPPPPPLDLGCDGAEVDTEDEYGSEELHAFNCFLAGLSELGYGFAYRVLDAQYFGLAQRRARVFVVGYLGDWRRAAAVLFERESLSWNHPPRREARKDIAGTLGSRTSAGGGLGTDFDLDGGLQVTHALRAEGFDASEDGTGRGISIVPAAFGGNNASGEIQVAAALNAKGGTGRHDFGTETLIAFDCKAGGNTGFSIGDAPGALRGEGHGGGHAAVASAMGVRRLMPVETERIQGFPDGYTAIPGAADGPRYKALGNSFAVPVVRWIGERIDAAERRQEKK